MPTEAEMTTRVDPGFHICYTRRAVIPAAAGRTLESLQALLDGSIDLEDALRKIKFFEDDHLLFSGDYATVEAVNVTTHYAPMEETP